MKTKKITKEEILDLLPYKRPFLFVDEILTLSEEQIVAQYTFKQDEFFYEGHFVNRPVTPGVILTECMAQIGLASLGLYLIRDWVKDTAPDVAMTSNEVNYYKLVLPGEKVVVTAIKEYFRFNKLKSRVEMVNDSGALVAKGFVSGMVIKY